MMQAPDKELEVAANVYRCGRLSALQQFHITRRLGPLLVVAGVSVEMLNKGMKIELDDMVAMAGPVMDTMARMSDDETNYILFNCLAVVKRKQGDLWAPMLAPDGKTFMFMDIDMPTMIRLVLAVLQHNLANFLPGLDAATSSPSA